MKLLNWIIDTYFPDQFVAREDFDHVQAREFPIVRRDMDQLRSRHDKLQQEYNELLCRGLHSQGFLPKFMDEREGQISVETEVLHIRDSFHTRVQIDVSDEYRRAITGRISPHAIKYVAKCLATHVERWLLRKFEPPYPGRPA